MKKYVKQPKAECFLMDEIYRHESKECSMIARHTPGPWIYTVDSYGDVAFENYVIYADREGNLQIDEPDLRLISAAPDLLEACETALEIIRDSWGDEQIERGDDQACNVLVAAIAKAKGGAA